MTIDVYNAVTNFQVTQTVQAAAYATGNAIGGLMTLTNATRGMGATIVTASVVFLETAIACDLIFFNANPSGSTITDKTALAVAAADAAKVIGVLHLTDITSLGTPGVVQGAVTQQPMTLNVPASATTLYAALIARGSITLSTTTDAVVTLFVKQS